MRVARTVAAVDGAVHEVLQEGWAKDSWLTKVTVRLTGALTLVGTTIVWPIDLLWSIPRALLSVTPLVKFLYLIPVSIVFFALSVPVVGTSWLWREIPFLRGMLIPVGVPFAVVGIAFTQVAFMGGPAREGVLKAWRKASFETWPLTLDMSDKASLEAAVLAY